MATNREILFVIKMRNQAGRVLREFIRDAQSQGKTLKGTAQEIVNAQKAANKFGTDMKEAGQKAATGARAAKDAAKQMGDAVEDAGRKARKAGGDVDAMGNRFLALRDILGPLSGLLAGYFSLQGAQQAVTFLSDFSGKMGELKASVGGAGPEFDMLQASVRNIGAVSVQGADGLADLSIVLAKAGLDARQASENLQAAAEFASAAGVEGEQASEFLIKTANAFGLGFDQLRAIGDISAKVVNATTANMQEFSFAMVYTSTTARQLGVSINDASAAIGTLIDAGFRGETAGTGLRDIMTSLLNPTERARTALRNMGLTTADVDIRTKGFIPVLQTLRDAGLDVNDAFNLVGVTSQGQLLALTSNIEKMQGLSDETKNAAGELKKFSDIKTDTLQGDFARLRAIVKEAILQFGDIGGVNILRTALQTITGVIAAFTGHLDQMANATEEQKARYQTIANVISAIGPVILSIMAINLAGWFASGAGAAVRLIGPIFSITSALRTIAPAATTAFGVLRTIVGVVLSPIATMRAVIAALPGVFTAAAAGVRVFTAAIAANPIGAIAVALVTVITLLYTFRDAMITVGGRTTTIGDIVAVVFERIASIFSTVTEAIVSGWNWISEVASDTWNGVKGYVGDFVSFAFRVFKAWANFVLNFWPALIIAVVGFVKSFVNTFNNAINAVIRSFGALGRTIGAILRGDFATAAREATAIFNNGFRIDTESATAGFRSAMGVLANDTVGQVVGAVGGVIDGVLSDAERRTQARARRNAQRNYSTNIPGVAPAVESPNGAGTEDAQAARRNADEAAKAAREFASAVESLVGKYAPAIKAQKDYNKELQTLTRLSALSEQELSAFGLSKQNVAGMSALAARRFREESDASFQSVQAMEEAVRVYGLGRHERELVAALLPIEKRLRDEVTLGIITEAQATDRLNRARAALTVTQQLARAQAFNDSFEDTLQGLRDEAFLLGVNIRERERYANYLKVARDAERAGITDIKAYLEEYAKAYEDVERRKIEAMGDWRSAALEWFEEYKRAAQDTAQNVTDLFDTAIGGLEDTLAGFVKDGKLDLKSLFDDIAEETFRKGFRLLVAEAGDAFGFGSQQQATTPDQTINTVLTQLQTSQTGLNATMTALSQTSTQALAQMQQVALNTDPATQVGTPGNPATVIIQNVDALASLLPAATPGMSFNEAFAPFAQNATQVVGIANDNGIDLTAANDNANQAITAGTSEIAQTLQQGAGQLAPEFTNIANTLASFGGLIGGLIGGGTGSVIGSLLGVGVKLLSSALGTPGGLLHDGGEVGKDGKRIMINRSLLKTAKRYHSGNLKSDEYPAILQKGEIVLSRNQVRALKQQRADYSTGSIMSPTTGSSFAGYGSGGISGMRGGMGGSGNRSTNVVVNQYISTPDASSFRASQGQQAASMSGAMRRAAARNT